MSSKYDGEFGVEQARVLAEPITPTALSDFDLKVAYETVEGLDATTKQKIEILQWILGEMVAGGFPPAPAIRNKIVRVLRGK